MNKNTIVSIIVPCYNYGRYVGETLDSLLAQTFLEWECLVVDDGSKDNSREVVQAYAKKDDRIKYIYQENKGLPGARNTGIQAAQGLYIQFLDADDILESEKLKEQVSYFESHPEIDFVYSGLMYFTDGEPDKLRYSPDWINKPWTLQKSGKGKNLLKDLIISSSIMPPMPLIKKSAIDRIGGFADHLKSCEDWEFWLRCANHNLIFHFLDKKNTRSLMRLHPSSMTKNRTIMLESMIEVREHINKMVEDENLKKINKDFLVNDWIEFAIVKQEHDHKQVGENYLLEKKNQVNSKRISFFQPLIKILSPQKSLIILRLIRSFMKKKYYSI